MRALSWVAVFAVGLAPMLVYWLATVIRRSVRRKREGKARRRANPNGDR
jgi:hypothetical protein